MSPFIEREMGGLHDKLVYRFLGLKPIISIYGAYVYPPLVEAMAEAGLQEVETYIA